MSTESPDPLVTTGTDRPSPRYTHFRCNKDMLPKLRRLVALRTARFGRRVTNGEIMDELVSMALEREEDRRPDEPTSPELARPRVTRVADRLRPPAATKGTENE